MELGGKSPNIVFADADLDRAVPVIVNSILQNGGPDLLGGLPAAGAASSVHDEVVERIGKIFAGVDHRPGPRGPATWAADLRSAARPRVMSYVERGRASEGRIVYRRSQPLSGGRYGDGYYFQPTLIDGVGTGAALCREEIFGPVLV